MFISSLCSIVNGDIEEDTDAVKNGEHQEQPSTAPKEELYEIPLHYKADKTGTCILKLQLQY